MRLGQEPQRLDLSLGRRGRDRRPGLRAGRDGIAYRETPDHQREYGPGQEEGDRAGSNRRAEGGWYEGCPSPIPGLHDNDVIFMSSAGSGLFGPFTNPSQNPLPVPSNVRIECPFDILTCPRLPLRQRMHLDEFTPFVLISTTVGQAQDIASLACTTLPGRVI